MPSVRIAPEYTESDGYDAARILRTGDMILDPWQQDVLDDWMSRGASGRWACPSCGGSVPRQNGKTALIQGRCSVGMLMFNEQVIYTAHLQKTATETFEEMKDFFENPRLKKYVREIKTALGREQIILKSGARIKFLARTRNGGRGQHGDLLVFDEAQELDESQQASFLPAISASLNPQTIYVGTPPDPNAAGTVFRGIRDRTRAGSTSRSAWFEFSVDEIGDVTDRERWAATNPALGRRILMSTIEGECEQMDEDTFARERLGWWSPITTETVDRAIPEDDWKACGVSEPMPEGKTAYGVKFTSDGSEVVLCGCVVPKDGPARIALIDRRPTGLGTRWLSEWLNERYHKACCVVIDGRNGVDLLIDRLKEVWLYKDSVIRVSSRNVIAAASQLTTELSEQTVTWSQEAKNHEALTASALGSIKRPISGGWGFGGDDPTPVEACALALWGCRTSKRDPSRKMRIG